VYSHGFRRWQRVAALAVPLLVSLASAVMVAREMDSRNRASSRVQGSMRLLAEVEFLRVRVVDAESSQRGYVITGDERFLEPFRGAEQDAVRTVASLRAWTAGTPAAARVDSIDALVKRRFRILEERIAIRRTQGLESAARALASGGGREVTTLIRQQLDRLRAQEQAELARREAAEAGFARSVFWTVTIGALLVLASVLMTTTIFHRYAESRRIALEEVERVNLQLQEQASELEAQAEQLQVQASELEETVTELQATQEELMAQQAQLETLTAELEEGNRDLVKSNRDLAEQTARAEEANRAKADFLAAMSHELRTPLNAVGGYADLLELGVHGEMNAAQLEALSRIRRNQRYLLGLIEDILNFARVEAGRIEIRSARVSLSDVLRGLEDVVAPLMETRRLHYACDPCGDHLTVLGERERIEQVLLNLLTNAAKFTPPDGRVQMWAEEDGDWVRIHVRDSGRGIPAGQQHLVFEPFVQLQRTPNEGSAQGIGLGLAISRELARAMGGDLTVESEPGVGSTFTLALPSAADPPGLPGPGNNP